MTRRFSFVTCVLVGMLAASAPLAQSADNSASLATQADLDNAIAETLVQEDAARGTITTLLQRSDVRAMAEGHGLDLQRAEAAVSTLQGDELQRVSSLAADANAQLTGGSRVTISVGLVGLLVILIVVILLTR